MGERLLSAQDVVGKKKRAFVLGTRTAICLKSIIFWDVTPSSVLSCNRRFGGTYRLHLQGRRKQVLAEIISSTLKIEAICSSELNRLHGVTSQKMILFIITAVKTSNLTQPYACLALLIAGLMLTGWLPGNR
jgi:hypothetical protein